MRKELQYADQLRRLMYKSMQPLGEELGLRQPEMALLIFLRNNPELNTARDAVAYRGFAKSNVSTAVESLERKGWLRVEPDPGSRRIKRLHLSETREKDLERLSGCQEETIDALTAGFTGEETAVLHHLLDRVAENAARALEGLEGTSRA